VAPTPCGRRGRGSRLFCFLRLVLLSPSLSLAALSFWLSNPTDWIDPLGQVTFCSFCSFCDSYFFWRKQLQKRKLLFFAGAANTVIDFLRQLVVVAAAAAAVSRKKGVWQRDRGERREKGKEEREKRGKAKRKAPPKRIHGQHTHTLASGEQREERKTKRGSWSNKRAEKRVKTQDNADKASNKNTAKNNNNKNVWRRGSLFLFFSCHCIRIMFLFFFFKENSNWNLYQLRFLVFPRHFLNARAHFPDKNENKLCVEKPTNKKKEQHWAPKKNV